MSAKTCPHCKVSHCKAHDCGEHATADQITVCRLRNECEDLRGGLELAESRIATLEAALSASTASALVLGMECEAWRALAAESSGRAASLDFSHNDATSYEAELVDYPSYGHVVATDGVYQSESFQAAAIALATKLGLIAGDQNG